MADYKKRITKENALNYVGKKFGHKNGREIKVLAYAENYFMMRFKGSCPFCHTINEVNKFLHDGVLTDALPSQK